MTARCARCGSVEVLLPEDPRPSPTCPDCGAPRSRPAPSRATTDDACDELREAFREDDHAADEAREWRGRLRTLHPTWRVSVRGPLVEVIQCAS